MRLCNWIFKRARGRGRSLECDWSCSDCGRGVTQMGPRFPDVASPCPLATAKEVEADA